MALLPMRASSRRDGEGTRLGPSEGLGEGGLPGELGGQGPHGILQLPGHGAVPAPRPRLHLQPNLYFHPRLEVSLIRDNRPVIILSSIPEVN